MKNPLYVTAAEAVREIKSGDRVFLHGSAATPVTLVKAMQDRHDELRNVELVSITTLGDVDFNNPVFRKSFFFNSLFVSAATREVANSDNGDYVPIFLSQIPQLFRKAILPIDVAMVQVSPPDHHGFCSLGTSVDIARSAVETARMVIAQVNPRMPRTHGDGFVHISKIDYLVHVQVELPELDYSTKINPGIIAIGKNVASLIEDGATLQMGIGGIPDQVLANLSSHKDLGIHTEMFSDGIIPLIEKGVITNRHKKTKCRQISNGVHGWHEKAV